MNAWGSNAYPASISSLVAKVVRALLNHKLAWLMGLYLCGKYVLYTKIGDGYLVYGHPANDFFPSWLYAINPLLVDFALTGLLIAGSRLAFAVAVPLSFLLVVHPHSFGFQHYVMSSYMFLWLAVKDERGSVWFGRVTLSFLYMAATIGKSTPGWISGQHYGAHLTHLHQHPYLILGGEFFFGIAFLLPFFLGVVIPAGIVFGMIYSISWGILDAVGPILGMLLTFVVYHESKSTPVSVALPNSGFGRMCARSLDWLNHPAIDARVSSTVEPAQATSEGITVVGREAWAALLARLPVLSLLCPVVDPRRLLVYR